MLAAAVRLPRRSTGATTSSCAVRPRRRVAASSFARRRTPAGAAATVVDHLTRASTLTAPVVVSTAHDPGPRNGEPMLHADTLTVVHHDDTRTEYTDVRYRLDRHGVHVHTGQDEVVFTEVLTVHVTRLRNTTLRTAA